MTLSQIEKIEAAWRILNRNESSTAKTAADSIVVFLQELDDDGVIDRLNEGRSGRDIIARLIASFSAKRSGLR